MFGAMRVVGGTFGTTGHAWVRDDVRLDIRSDRRRIYSSDEVKRVDARVETEKKFGCFSFIVGALVFCGIGVFLLGPLGALIGLGLAIALSFYTTKRQVVEVTLSDESKVVLECAQWQVRKLIALQRT